MFDVEQNHIRFLSDLTLNLWDCGGQVSFMESYLNVQRYTIFSHVGVLIYVYDVEAREPQRDADTYRECLDALLKFSPDMVVFLLVHKMDLDKQLRHKALPVSSLLRHSRLFLILGFHCPWETE